MSTTRLQSHVRLSGHHKGEGVEMDTSVEDLFDDDDTCEDCGGPVGDCECDQDGDEDDEDGGEG